MRVPDGRCGVSGVVVAMLVASLVAGCGGSSAGSSTASTSATSSTSASSSTSSRTSTSSNSLGTSSSSGLNLTAYVVHGSQETGFKPQGAPTITKSLTAYESTGPATGSAGLLKSEGFTAIVNQGTAGSNGKEGGSFALELGSASAAAHEQPHILASVRQDQSGAKLVRFTVPGIPGSVGLHAVAPTASQSTSNVYWHEGRCVIWVGDFGSTAPVIAAAKAIWRTTRGHKGACATG